MQSVEFSGSEIINIPHDTHQLPRTSGLIIGMLTLVLKSKQFGRHLLHHVTLDLLAGAWLDLVALEVRELRFLLEIEVYFPAMLF